jgi:beta,beta-carotene 9',10'-dioxygenase
MQRPLATESIELPRIHYARVAGKPYRFVWGTGDAGGHDFSSRLVKIETETGNVSIWRQPRCYPGEPVFVPAPSATTEDDGVILSVVLDSGKGRSFLLVLDASTLAERARAEVPHHIPFHFHGNYFAAGADHPPRTLHR